LFFKLGLFVLHILAELSKLDRTIRIFVGHGELPKGGFQSIQSESKLNNERAKKEKEFRSVSFRRHFYGFAI
jgi:hypothetical protein